VYRRAGVPHLWLLEPARETVEVYQLRSKYELQGTFGPGQSFAVDLFTGERFAVDDLFKTQFKRWRERHPEDDDPEREEKPPQPIPEWLAPADFHLGLEYFFHLGHPERRWEFWGNKAHSVLAFGSAREARARLEHFVTEACQWESLPRPKLTMLAVDVDQAEVGRFRLTRQGRLVFLDVTVDGRKYKELLKIWGKSEAWDWGDRPSRK
jgi:hypothetical protein